VRGRHSEKCCSKWREEAERWKMRGRRDVRRRRQPSSVKRCVVPPAREKDTEGGRRGRTAETETQAEGVCGRRGGTGWRAAGRVKEGGSSAGSERNRQDRQRQLAGRIQERGG